jgi:hypothetical protein
MGVLLTVIGSVLLFLTLEVLWCRPARDPARGSSASDSSALPDPLALTFVRNRLDVLAAELERLDNDPEIFAKAFRTHAARSAYQDLLVDAARLGEASRFVGVSPLSDVTMVEVEMAVSASPCREELDI